MVHYIEFEVVLGKGKGYYRPSPKILHYEYCKFEDVPFLEFSKYTIKSVGTYFCLPNDDKYHMVISDWDEFCNRPGSFLGGNSMNSKDFVDEMKPHMRSDRLSKILNRR